MSTFTVNPRVEFDTKGHVRMRVYDDRRKGDRYLYLHRLVAYAHGKLDSVFDDSLHVHHENEDKWDNRPENLTAMEPERHTVVTHT